MPITVTSQSASSFAQAISNGSHQFVSDMPTGEGDDGQSPSPFELLYGAWGACTNMTLQVYARRKGWPLQRVVTTLQELEPGSHARVQKKIQVWGDLSAEQLGQLKRVAEKCPVNRYIMQQPQPQAVTSSIEHVPG